MNRKNFSQLNDFGNAENDLYNGTFLSILNNEYVMFDAYQMEHSFMQLYDKVNKIEKENVQSYTDSMELFFMNNMDYSYMNYEVQGTDVETA